MTALLDQDVMTPRERSEAETEAFAAAAYVALSDYVAAADDLLARAEAMDHTRPISVRDLISQARAMLREPLALVAQS
jgi:hypothetical protein